MPILETWEWAVLAIAVYLAVSSLARLMRGRRDGVLVTLTLEAEAERLRQAEQRKQSERESKPRSRASA